MGGTRKDGEVDGNILLPLVYIPYCHILCKSNPKCYFYSPSNLGSTHTSAILYSGTITTLNLSRLFEKALNEASIEGQQLSKSAN